MEKRKNKIMCCLSYFTLLKKLVLGLYLKIYIAQNKFFITTTRALFFSLIKILKMSSMLNLNYLINVVVNDLPGKPLRFKICYTLRSTTYNQFVDVILYTSEVLAVPTLTLMYKNALWIEREIWDFFGILFTNNTNLTRILNDYGFRGYPLRKDFPLIGFDEITYCEISKKIKINSIEVSSEYKLYNWHAIWN